METILILWPVEGAGPWKIATMLASDAAIFFVAHMYTSVYAAYKHCFVNQIT